MNPPQEMSSKMEGRTPPRVPGFPWVRSVLEDYNLVKKRQEKAKPFNEVAWNALESTGFLRHLHDIYHQINLEAGWVVLDEERLRRRWSRE